MLVVFVTSLAGMQVFAHVLQKYVYPYLFFHYIYKSHENWDFVNQISFKLKAPQNTCVASFFTDRESGVYNLKMK